MEAGCPENAKWSYEARRERSRIQKMLSEAMETKAGPVTKLEDLKVQKKRSRAMEWAAGPTKICEVLEAGAPEDAKSSFGVSCSHFRLFGNQKVEVPDNAKWCHGAACGPQNVQILQEYLMWALKNT